MKNLPLLFLIPLSFLSISPSISLAQTNCTKYIGGEITCTGPGGYRVEAREHINGQTSFYDSNGNVGTVNQHPNGGVSVTPTQVGRSAPPPVSAYSHPTSSINVGSQVIPARPNLLFD